MSQRDLITTHKAAVLIGLSYDPARKVLRDAGLKPVQKIGSSYLWDEDEVLAVAERRKAVAK